MQIDQRKLNRVLNMNDRQLEALIGQLAAEIGITPQALGLDPNNLAEIRSALSNASAADLEQLNRMLNAKKPPHT